MSQDDIIMLVGGAIAAILALIEEARVSGQSLIGWGVVVLGAVFVVLAIR